MTYCDYSNQEKYPFELPELPYEKDAFSPDFSSETFDYHHGKHHNAYVTNLNNLLKDNKEFTEIDLPRMRGFAEHEDVRARTKYAIASASDDYRAHLRVFETNPLDSVIKLNIDAQIIGIELELVAFAQPAVLIDFHRQRRNRRTLPVDLQRPVPVLVGRRLIVDGEW